jgi:ATP-dependent protease ClpP protease subunit
VRVFIIGLLLVCLSSISSAKTYKVYVPQNLLTGTVDVAVNTMLNARAGDIVYVYLKGIGGQLIEFRKFKQAYRKTKAKVIAVIYGDVSSTHALIAATVKHRMVSNRKAKALYHPGVDTETGRIVMHRDVKKVMKTVLTKKEMNELKIRDQRIYPNVVIPAKHLETGA